MKIKSVFLAAVLCISGNLWLFGGWGYAASGSSNLNDLGKFGISRQTADINGDGIVDFEDLAILADQWLQPPGNPSADIAPSPNGDDIADFLDFATMANSWLVDSTLVYSLAPYVMAWDETTEKIRLETNNDTTVLINYGKTPSYGNSIDDTEPNTSHEITLTSLDPGTRYYYQVIADANESTESLEFHSSFITSDNSKTSFRFGIFGDSRGDYCGEVGSGSAGAIAYQSMLQQMVDKNVEFVIINGDDVQCNSNGPVTCPETITTYKAAWNNFHDSSAPLRNENLSISYLSSLGNHELAENGFSSVGFKSFQDYWVHPRNGGGLPGDSNETTYSWRYGNSLFVFLNSEERGHEGYMSEEQRSWLENSIKQPGYTHKFVISHRPLVGSIRSGFWGALQCLDPNASARIDNLMYDNNVTAGFYSHDHCYKYLTTHDGNMIHVITGGAGAAKRACLYEPNNGPFGGGENMSSIDEPNRICIPTLDTWHYIIVDVNDIVMTANVYNDKGDKIHGFSKTIN